MYTSFYALSAKPFALTPDPDFLYLSRSHKEALAHLTYGVESKSGFVMVTGEVGSGKTTLLRTLTQNLGDSVILSQVTNTRVSYTELLELILEDFGLNPRGLNKTALLSALNDFLIDEHQKGHSCVLIVDEAQHLRVPTLEGLRMLSNIETGKSKLVHIVLSGQPGLKKLIDSSRLEQLRQRITVRYHLGPLSPGESGEYIRHRLGKVITDPEKAPVFPDETIPTIHEATGGIPRLINVLCDAALLHGYVEESRVIRSDIVEEVAVQITLDQKGVEPAKEEFGRPADPSIDQRIRQIEDRLEAMATDVKRTPTVVATSADLAVKAASLDERARELEGRERIIEQRLAELEEHEDEFNRRLARVKQEWKRRMGQLEEARQRLLRGGMEFPPLKVYVFDPDPRIKNAITEFLEGAGIASEAWDDFGAFYSALGEASAGGWFAVGVVGSVADDAENVSHVAELSSNLAHVPTVFLSDIDLSTIRRKILSAGANYFIEKPNGRAASLATHRQSMEHLKSDLLRVLRGSHEQYKAFFATFVAPGDAAEEPEG